MAVDVWMRDTYQDIESFPGVVIFEHLWLVKKSCSERFIWSIDLGVCGKE